MDTEQILREMKLFSLGGEGIGGWITPDSDSRIFERLGRLDLEPLSAVQLNQLLVFGKESPVSDDFFRYYWLEDPLDHPYPVGLLPGFSKKWVQHNSMILSLEHLKWGLHRLFVDSLLYFGNVRTAYRRLRSLTKSELIEFFASRRFDTSRIKERGPALPLSPIPKDDRYLISEMACKSYGDDPSGSGDLKHFLAAALGQHHKAGGGKIKLRDLLQMKPPTYGQRQSEFEFSATELLDEEIFTSDDLDAKLVPLVARFFKARDAALENTRYYLSMADDLDVYVATSMRGREDFRKMASTCETIFADSRLKELQLRYFDPTLSAAAGHEDKGIIECLMVKCAKLLVYCAGEKESYGKDAEAAMALSLGKPVIFYCDEDQRSRFYRDVHPLSRLVEFQTGVVVGAMVTDTQGQVSELLYRIFENKMEYVLEQPKPGHLRLKDRLTDSVVRVQTGDPMLSATFYNLYHNRDAAIRRGA
ncbi:MAG TPA: hypothetical protein VNN25_24655 [Thermoanaerobaculia bacterium]|nr:hypothetical protein [Thermoanaerobaculia bacterium]